MKMLLLLFSVEQCPAADGTGSSYINLKSGEPIGISNWTKYNTSTFSKGNELYGEIDFAESITAPLGDPGLLQMQNC